MLTYKECLQRKTRPLFVPFAVLGDPDPERSFEVVRTLVEHGADALELGFPFSDPPADGPVIQAADVRALRAGMNVDGCFALLGRIRAFTDMPIGLLVYGNLVLQRGVDRFYADCAASGVTSVLVADFPLEHGGETHGAALAHGIAPVSLVSELTTTERLDRIVARSAGYLYVVSYVGVTGAEDGLSGRLAGTLARIRSCTDLPLLAGFGIHTASHANAAIAAGADGVIVGSAIVRLVPDLPAIGRLCGEIAEAVRGHGT